MINLIIMKKYLFPFFLLSMMIIVATGCCNVKQQTAETATAKIEIDSLFPSEQLLNSVAWFQLSPEFKACCYQAFNVAEYSLKENLKELTPGKKAAVVFDLDETLLDNSKYEADLIINNKTWNQETWTEWVKIEKTEAVPGAIDFIKFIMDNNMAEVFYISNRLDSAELEPTIRNMSALGFPEVDKSHFYFKTEGSDKKIRRDSLLNNNYEIVMLVGDNLSDFADVFSKKMRDKDNINTLLDGLEQNKKLFGKKFIIIPNPMYGDWEETIGRTSNQKRENIFGWN